MGPSRKAFSSVGERDRRHRAQLAPVGLAGEQLGVEADGAGVQRLALGLRYPGEDALHLLEQRLDEERAPDRRHAQGGEDGRQHPAGRPEPPRLKRVRLAVEGAGLPDQHGGGEPQQPGPERRLPHAQDEGPDDAEDDQHQLGHGLFSFAGAPNRAVTSLVNSTS